MIVIEVFALDGLGDVKDVDDLAFRRWLRSRRR